MYEKVFLKLLPLLPHFKLTNCFFSYLSVAIRAFSIITYCHLLPHSGEKWGILSEKAEEYLLFSQKNIKKVEKKACGFEHFFVFLQPTGKIPADSTKKLTTPVKPLYTHLTQKPMTQADLVRLYFAKGDVYNSWNYCFN